MKTDGEMIRHLIGNPLFAIETNLVSLERRMESLKEPLMSPDKRIEVGKESAEIVAALKRSVEKIKEVLEDLEK